jgi:adenylate cyclase
VVGVVAVLLVGRMADRPIHRISVLALRNLTGDSTVGALADGLTEELTARIGRVAALQVTSSNSAMQYRGSPLSTAQIAHALGVEGVIEGALVRWKDRARITVQTIDARSDRHFGAVTLERSWDSLFTAPAELADSVLRALRVQPTPEERRRVDRRSPRSTAVAALLARGRWERALAVDSTDARAWAAKSIAMAIKSWLPTDSPSWRAAPYVQAAREAAVRAVSLDSNESEAQHALGNAAVAANDFPLAERALRRAIALQPSNAVAISDLAGLLPLVGRTEEGLAEARRATRLDPLSPMVRVNLNWVLLVAQRWDEYDRAAREYLRIWPDPQSRADLIGGSLMIARLCEGRPEEAAAALDTAFRINNTWASRTYDPMRLIILAKLGRMDEARTMLRRLEARPWFRQFWMAWAYAAVGDSEKAVAAFRNAAAMYEGGLQATVQTCLADPLRKDPRWPELLGLLNMRP